MVDTSTLAGVMRASQPTPQRRTQMRQTEPAPAPRPQNTTQTFLDSWGQGLLRNQETQAEQRAVNHPLNPLPFTTEAAFSGRRPGAADIGTDIGLNLAGGIIGKGLATGARAASNALPPGFLSGNSRPALETGEAIQARRDAIMRLLDRDGPYAINEYLKFPQTAYTYNIHRGTLENFFKNTSERIPRGLELYRAPNSDEVLNLLPRERGAIYTPGVVRSTGGSSDLDRIGQITNPKSVFDTTGGNQQYAPGLAKIHVMDDIPGIVDINEFLAKYPFLKDSPRGGLGQSGFNLESVLGPQTSYYVDNFYPAVGDSPPYWILSAFKR